MSDLKRFEHLKVQLKAIRSATNNFNENHRIGKGGFGKVYKGELFHWKGHTHTTVALKCLDRAFGQGDREFWNEILMLSLYKHENIVPLLGFCDDGGEKILVYEYASRRGLDLYLNSSNLTWVRRLKICIGVARGLTYLHDPGETQQRVLHRDIKSSNILLDENWNAMIADFGLSKFCPANLQYSFIFSNPVGTFGYSDPLYTETGLLTKEHYKENNLNGIIFGNIKDKINKSSLTVFSVIAYQCLKRDRNKRPLMNEILTTLETALEYQQNDLLNTGAMDKLQQLQESVPLESRAKRDPVVGFDRLFTRSLRRTTISEKLRKLQEVVPNMKKQTSTADMLGLTLDYIKELHSEAKFFLARKGNKASC
ncbi:hypothetical protein Lser_V15G22676 [Lactuca serriola]